MNSKHGDESNDPWIAEYDAAAIPLAPRVDFSAALEEPTRQLLIVPTADARDQLAGVVKGIACLAWEDGARQDIAPLLKRAGRRVFLWLSHEGTIAWLGDRLSSAGFDVSVVQWPGNEFASLTSQPWPKLKDWVLGHMVPWRQDVPWQEDPAEAPGAAQDILPEPGEAPPIRSAEKTPPKPASKKKGDARQKAIAENNAILATLAAEHEIELRGKGMTIDDWMKLGLHISQGQPTANVSNISLIFDAIKEGEIWYDEFLQSIMCRDGRSDGNRLWTDADDIRTTIEMQRACGVPKANKAIVRDAVVEYAMRNVKNCLREYIVGLVWDKVPRIDHAFEDLFDVEHSDYHAEVSRNFFKSLVARAIWPGCKVDTMPVFEGAQGQGKSLVIEKLVGADYYAVMKESPDSKDFYVFMAGKWLIEIAELDAFSRADVKSVKRALSTAIDRYRTPYGRHAADFKRQCVFAGSTNHDDWNHDATGARRFWPVACRAAYPERAEANRDQYFAEAMHALMHEGDRPTWWMFTPETAKRVKEEQSARFVDDDWTNTVRHVILGRDYVYPQEIYRELGFEADKDITRAAQMRVAEIMKREGWSTRDIWDKVASRPRRRWIKV